MPFINLATLSLGMINPIETFSLVYNLYLYFKNVSVDQDVMPKRDALVSTCSSKVISLPSTVSYFMCQHQ